MVIYVTLDSSVIVAALREQEEKHEECKRLLEKVKDGKFIALDFWCKKCSEGFYPLDEALNLSERMAKALVMPTFFGPTNIPQLEAFAMGCPVITSNIRGIKEQMGDAGLLIDPKNPTELADAIYTIWTNNELRTQLIENGYKKIKEWTIEDFATELGLIIEDCKRYIPEKSCL